MENFAESCNFADEMENALTATNVDKPELWRLSLMLAPDSMDVYATRRMGEPEVIARHLDLGPAVGDHAGSLEEAVYANPMLLQPFAKTDIVVDGGFSLVVPAGTPTDYIDELFPSESGTVTLRAPMDLRNDLLYRLDTPVHNFILRTFDRAKLTHSLAVLEKYFEARSRLGNSSKMYVDIERGSMNVLIFNQLGLAMASSYRWTDINDAAYYALAGANTAGFDFTRDEMLVAGNAERRGELMGLLRRFVRRVHPAVFPSVISNEPAAFAAPFPLVILPLCE